MAQDQRHPANCEKATGETCRCSHCAGTQHGWVGAFHLIRSGTPETLHNFERDADQRWREECRKQDSKSQKQPTATRAHQKSAVDSARANLIRHFHEQLPRNRGPHLSDTSTRGESREPAPQPMAERPSSPTDRTEVPEHDPASTDRTLTTAATEAEQIEALGHLLGQVLNDVEKDIGPLRPGTRQALADHFWCELLVQLVLVIEKSNQLLDSVPETVTKGIIESRRENRRTEIQRKIVSACVKQAWKRLAGAFGLTVLSDAKALLPVLRALAVLMCKSPPQHRAVVRHCLDPLKSLLLQETKKQLLRVFGGLVPRITSDIDGDGPPVQPG